MKQKNIEIKVIFTVVIAVFSVFLLFPFLKLLGQAFMGDGSFSMKYFSELLQEKGFLTALKNSVLISITSAFITEPVKKSL